MKVEDQRFFLKSKPLTTMRQPFWDTKKVLEDVRAWLELSKYVIHGDVNFKSVVDSQMLFVSILLKKVQSLHTNIGVHLKMVHLVFQFTYVRDRKSDFLNNIYSII